MQKTALVFGSTGLVGSYLVSELAENSIYEKVIVFNRKKQNYSNNKIVEILIDYGKISEYTHEFKGHDAFCCLGSTIRKAGTKENFFKIDHDLPVEIARICSNNQVSSLIVISSIGANPESSNNYLKTKGLMEKHITEFDFTKIVFVRPSMLLGPRKEFRFGEIAGKGFMAIFNFLFIGESRKYRGIHALTVAKSMIEIANMPTNKIVFESDELIEIAKND
ncbi:MAG: hypothetical protein A2X13_00455 [Bacteroidetes bacterium GWC2_33_15]|nr:MAG: hypothetical protein A2X10_04265 [Bacteroidetes bacterium GWA2_33_15]OFX51093.1 MAG: hypothetical protein A2X13_00455 [Bacteroidetes bacterium GWC2_33_15]OFX66474.1 MAG: hypothetical protein A2X15_07500 [Bacteroidetes bacterium GWB2_32_14]OFX70301.1 MAG: hypothetical protein A2X14_03345 [Bacteroidetes bacterium GWD2_33_33]HAN17300.1 oxidoreductase [Bacteroidales bacterium]